MKTDQIAYTRTLDYCDGILVFEARDPIGGSYVASCLNFADGGERYLVVGCRPELLRRFRVGEVDLRSLLTESAINGWYLADFLGPRRPLEIIEVGRVDFIPDGLLPEPGYKIFDSEVNHELVKTALERSSFMLEVFIQPPKVDNSSAVGIRTLNRLVSYLQELARGAAEEIAGSQGRGRAGRLDVVGVAEGSLVVTLQGATRYDEDGELVLDKAFQRLDNLLDKVEASQELDTDTAEYALPTIQAYSKLMKLFKEEDTGFQYTWATPTANAPSHRKLSLERVQILENALPETLARRPNEVPTEEIELAGTLEVADQLKHRWVIKDAGGTLWRGEVPEGYLDLNELIIGAEYKFTCSRRMPEVGSRGRRPLLKLLAISEP